MKKSTDPGKLKAGREEKAAVRKLAQDRLREIVESPTASAAQQVAASRALLLDTRPKGRKSKTSKSGAESALTGQDIAAMRVRLRQEPFMELLAERRNEKEFLEDFKERCERSLYFFTKFVGIAPDLTRELHKPVCDWLQRWPEIGGNAERIKLLMMPTQHLKTSMASHGLPLHVVIQPKERNGYFPGKLGRDSRVALIGESADKARENLSVIASHLETNVWIRALWPEAVWREKKDAPHWSRDFVSIPREVIRGEPTFTALGAGTALYQRHWDVIICDDLIGWDAAGSPATMKDINEWRKGLLTRRHSPLDSVMLFIGTHFTPTDIYVSMKAELSTANVVSRSVIEEGEPIWPIRFPMAVVEQLKRSMGLRLFSHLYMNLPTAEGITGFDWNYVRLFEMEGQGLAGTIVFVEEEIDEEIRAIYADPITRIVSRWKRGEPLSSLYPSRGSGEFTDPYDEKNRDRIGGMAFADQTRLKQLSFLRGKYGEKGPIDWPDGGAAATGRGFESIEVRRGPTTVLVPRPN